MKKNVGLRELNVLEILDSIDYNELFEVGETFSSMKDLLARVGINYNQGMHLGGKQYQMLVKKLEEHLEFEFFSKDGRAKKGRSIRILAIK